MIGFTSKINSLGTNERLFYFSFNCKFKSLKWIWQITHKAKEHCGRKARLPKILGNPSNTRNKSQSQLVESCVSLEHIFVPPPLGKIKVRSIMKFLTKRASTCGLLCTTQPQQVRMSFPEIWRSDSFMGEPGCPKASWFVLYTSQITIFFFFLKLTQNVWFN